jgi:hypothetical protein
MAEEAKLPEDYDKLINKFEQFLKLTLRKEPKKAEAFSQGVFDTERIIYSKSNSRRVQESKHILGLSSGILDIKKADLSKVTTGDLKRAREEMIISEIKEKVEEENKKGKGFWSRFFGSDDEIRDESEEEDLEDIEEIEELRERD